ncbi:LPXTG cell wall anchor domain-containing protein [Subtercola lobariae]|uniref:Gram-positive cocci surface proteins LPxTG domain-containing protein n=1 Tax=Subtercola lobariae TaxID=1588641 RepID=A0A917BC11_9MICO|nr:LPXTG cell wall anchor domain-containing protein [Subtercola lobariae]GGF35829.1 hypothetical protein GCM10011399_31010 [Subtercola lobariae]
MDSRTVTVSGSVDGSATVIVYAADGTTVLGSTNVTGDSGVATPYQVTLPAYADDAATSQTIEVGGLLGGSGIPQVKRTFNLPASNFGLTVTSPTEGEALDSRTVVFSGAGADGSTVNVLDSKGDPIPGTTDAVVSDGSWTTTGTYADDATVDQTVSVNQVSNGAGHGTVIRSFTLPAPALFPAPVITSPTNGQALTGSTVTFTGTGKPGANIALIIAPTAALKAQAKAKAAPAKPTDPIVVDPTSGIWTVTLALQPNDYTAVATEVTLDSDGNLIAIISEPSAPVEFTLAAAAVTPVVVVTPTTPTTTAATSASGTLAETGLDATALAGLSALLLLAGAVLVLVRRKRHTS